MEPESEDRQVLHFCKVNENKRFVEANGFAYLLYLILHKYAVKAAASGLKLPQISEIKNYSFSSDNQFLCFLLIVRGYSEQVHPFWKC